MIKEKMKLLILQMFGVMLLFSCSNPVVVDIAEGDSTKAKTALSETELEVSCDYSNWGSSFNGTFSVKNPSAVEIEGWTVEFDWEYDITGSWGAEKLSKNENHYVFAPLSWGKKIAPGQTVTFGVSGIPTANNTGPSNLVGKSGSGSSVPVVTLPEGPSDILEAAYGTINETDTAFTGLLLVGNVNNSYVWNGSFFAVNPDGTTGAWVSGASVVKEIEELFADSFPAASYALTFTVYTVPGERLETVAEVLLTV